jgi:hypothetical protein
MVPTDVAVRCAAHPSRPAVDACPVCDRPRCGADQVAAPGGGCTVCGGADGRPARRPARPPDERELLVRAALAAYAAAVAWGYVTAEYVGAGYFAYLSPAVLGVLCGGAATSAAGSPRPGPLLQRVRLAAVLLALLGSGLGFVLEGTYGVLSASTDVLVPYAITVAAAWLWTSPPRAARSS